MSAHEGRSGRAPKRKGYLPHQGEPVVGDQRERTAIRGQHGIGA